MTLLEKLKSDITTAMKAKDKETLSTLRLVSSELTKESQKPKNHGKLTEEQEQAVLSREVKARKEALEAFSAVGNQAKADEAKREIDIINQYRPDEMPEDDIRRLVKDYLSTVENPKFGPVMGVMSKQLKGKIDGNILRQIIEEIID